MSVVVNESFPESKQNHEKVELKEDFEYLEEAVKLHERIKERDKVIFIAECM